MFKLQSLELSREQIEKEFTKYHCYTEERIFQFVSIPLLQPPNKKKTNISIEPFFIIPEIDTHCYKIQVSVCIFNETKTPTHYTLSHELIIEIDA